MRTSSPTSASPDTESCLWFVLLHDEKLSKYSSSEAWTSTWPAAIILIAGPDYLLAVTA
jgi:hypothetical protein